MRERTFKRIRQRQAIVVTLGLCLVSGGPVRAETVPGATDGEGPEEAATSLTIGEGAMVEFDYTLTVNGEVVDSTEGQDPFSYLHGQGQIVPGLERQLTGLRVGDRRELTVEPNEGYGPVDPNAFIEVGRNQLRGDVVLRVGVVLDGVDLDGRQVRGTIHKITGEIVTLDINHSLAGKTLHFKVHVVGISPPQ